MTAKRGRVVSHRPKVSPRPPREYIAVNNPRPDFLAVLPSARQALADASRDANGQPKQLGRPRKAKNGGATL